MALDEKGVARIVFQSRSVIAKTCEFFLGRTHTSTEGDAPFEFIAIGDLKVLSRKHVRIFWDSTQVNPNGTSWFLQCLSRNGCKVDGFELGQDLIAPLRLHSYIETGSIPFHFVLPTLSAPKPPPKPRVSKAAAAAASTFDPNDIVPVSTDFLNIPITISDIPALVKIAKKTEDVPKEMTPQEIPQEVTMTDNV